MRNNAVSLAYVNMLKASFMSFNFSRRSFFTAAFLFQTTTSRQEVTYLSIPRDNIVQMIDRSFLFMVSAQSTNSV